MYSEVIGNWPTDDRFILTSCDEKYFNDYFPRFFSTFTKHWKLPIHVHLINPSTLSLQRLDKLDMSHTYCDTTHKKLHWPHWYVTYCQAQRFILLGHRITENQSIIVADVDCYAQQDPSDRQRNLLSSDMCFTTFNSRLMATFCNFHGTRRKESLQAAKLMEEMIEDTPTVGVDQKVIKKIFAELSYNELTHGEWIRHWDVKSTNDQQLHDKCLVYHQKGCRGKEQGKRIEWTDIGL